MDRPLRLISANPLDALARTVEALLVVASQPLTLEELAEATADDVERITRDLIGQNRLSVSLPDGSRVSDLMALLRDQYPALTGVKSVLVAVNSEYAEPGTLLNPSDEIALIPPVSGG